jgi:uncharacterized protein
MDIADLREKAEAGSVVAQTVLGICYLDEIDVEVDYKEAFRLLSAAADKGVPRAAANLARMYAEGLGIAASPITAIRFHEAAARAGELSSQVALGRIYLRGIGVRTDADAALRWYSNAASQDGRFEDCEELREAKSYVTFARGGKSPD